MKWLVRFWKDQAAVMLYKDLREIVIGEADPQSCLINGSQIILSFFPRK